MREMRFDEERLIMYYVNRFVRDLEDYFNIPKYSEFCTAIGAALNYKK